MSRARHTQTVDVAVVGGGVIGLAVAWRARILGLSVLLLERAELAGAASHVAAGMLAPVSEAEFGEAGRRLLDLGLASAQRWSQWSERLSEASGQPLGVRTSGTLVVARDRDEAEALEREIALREALGLRTNRLRGSQARELEPALSPTVRLGLEAPDDHSVDPRLVCAALTTACERAGARLREGVSVQRLLLDASARCVEGVVLAGGEHVRAAQVVVAAGAWSADLKLPPQARAPVRPVKGQILRLRDPAGPGLLGRVLRFAGGYLVPRADGGYVLGATVEERGFDTTVTAGGVLELLREAQELLPGVSELVIEEMSAGLRPGSPDNLPIIGASSLEGLVWATGHYRNGILLAPLTADLVGDVLCDRSPDPLAELCGPDRLLAPVGA